ncbi:MAG TPA: DUF4232 domain-containing protein [Acidimicrobiales bacterium]|nr:DUF4232 domain-containing protein [Acidimicrobiales bacterium]
MLVLLAASGLVLASCSSSPGPPKKKSHGTTTTAPPVTTTSSPTGTTIAAAPGPPCKVSALHVTQGGSGAAAGGAATTSYVVTNISKAACSLSGYPGIQLLAADGSNITTTLQQGGTGIPAKLTVQTVNLVRLGGQASFLVYFVAVPSKAQPICKNAPKMKLTFPGSSNSVNTAAEIQACGGVLQVSPFQPGITAGS